MAVPGLSGIVNIGNSCYMNSVLQCLSATDILNYYFRTVSFKDELRDGVKRLVCKKTNKSDIEKNKLRMKFKESITYRLYQLIAILWQDNDSVKPDKFKRSLDLHCNKFRGFAQQDAHEFLMYILDRMHEEIKTDIAITNYMFSPQITEYMNIMDRLKKTIEETSEVSPVKSELQEQYMNLKKSNQIIDVYVNGIQYYINFLKKNHSIISDLFLGLYLSEIVCSNCNNITYSYEPFNVITLEISDSKLNLFSNLQECFNNFLTVEDIEYTCESCKNKNISKKSLHIFYLPEKLIIHFKRFKCVNGRSCKLNNTIDFPLDNLYINSISDINSSEKNPYELYSIVHHNGTSNGGHYIASTKNPINNAWYNFNDSSVSKTKASNIVDNSAYMIFYQRKRIDKYLIEDSTVKTIVDSCDGSDSWDIDSLR